MFRTGAASQGISAIRAKWPRPAAAGAADPGNSGVGVADAAAWVMKAAFVVVVMLSTGNFGDSIVSPDTLANLQQLIALTMWVVLLFASIFAPPLSRIEPSADVVMAVAFYGFAALSVAWSNYSPVSLLKALALIVTAVGAYRIAVRMSIDDIVACVIAGLLALIAVSLLLVLLAPDIGLDRTWMHKDQWVGVFESKQTLGTAGAFLMFFASQRVLAHGGKTLFLMTFSPAAACVMGSGSRGGGAVALAAIATLYLSRRFATLGKVLAFGPVLMISIAGLLIAYFVATGNDYILLFDDKVDLTERTHIWQYALRHFEDSGMFGFGLNGFWSQEQLFASFNHEHGWVLDNFHSGYITILMETGVIGLTLFALTFLFFATRMSSLTPRQVALQPRYNMAIVFANLSFLLNLTETFFLRSTNFISMLLLAFLLVSAARPPDVPGRSQQAWRAKPA
jgi:exopolysaccharide production protein ExoQ